MRFPEPVVLVRGPERDRHGDPLPDTEQRVELRGAFADSSSTEDTTGRGATVTTAAQLWLPYGTTVLRTDRVEVRGRVWEVDGDPQPWRSPLSGTAVVTQVNLRSVRG